MGAVIDVDSSLPLDHLRVSAAYVRRDQLNWTVAVIDWCLAGHRVRRIKSTAHKT